jgi:hypothetical protein
MAVWRKYFGPDALIFGIDIDQRCAVFDGHAGAVRIGSQDDPKFLNSIVKEMGGLDVVIDDGSHKAKHQLASFELLASRRRRYLHLRRPACQLLAQLPRWVSPQGHVHRVSKQLIDDMHVDFHSWWQLRIS